MTGRGRIPAILRLKVCGHGSEHFRIGRGVRAGPAHGQAVGIGARRGQVVRRTWVKASRGTVTSAELAGNHHQVGLRGHAAVAGQGDADERVGPGHGPPDRPDRFIHPHRRGRLFRLRQAPCPDQSGQSVVRHRFNLHDSGGRAYKLTHLPDQADLLSLSSKVFWPFCVESGNIGASVNRLFRRMTV